MDVQRLTNLAAALATDTRARMVCALLSGTAHTSQELARHAAVTPSTASGHLGQLLAAGLVTVEAQGRHRYFRLADGDVAKMVETMVAVASDVAPVATPTAPSGLAFARSCYDHLAGALGVRLYDRFIELDAIRVTSDSAMVTPSGRALLADIGIDVVRGSGRPVVRACLDWSQRRHHMAGVVGARLLAAMLERRWLYRSAHRRRELRLAETGRHALHAHFGLEIT